MPKEPSFYPFSKVVSSVCVSKPGVLGCAGILGGELGRVRCWRWAVKGKGWGPSSHHLIVRLEGG